MRAFLHGLAVIFIGIPAAIVAGLSWAFFVFANELLDWVRSIEPDD